MFERFTDRARRVLVLAQEEARLLNHGFIGTEHILLGLIHEGDGVAARALEQMEITLDDVREKVEETIGLSGGPPIGSPPFTPRAKKVLEVSLNESLQLGHNYIGTEHILLGLIREGEGVGAHVLVSLGAGLEVTRETVLTILRDQPSLVDPLSPFERPRRTGSYTVLRRRSLLVNVGCTFCGRQPPEAGRLFTKDDASICEHCVRQWAQQLAGDEDRPDGD